MLPFSALNLLQDMARNPANYALLLPLGSLQDGGETVELSAQGLEQEDPTSTLVTPNVSPKAPIHGIDPEEFLDAPTLQAAWPEVTRNLLHRRVLCWNTPNTLQVLRASLQGHDPQELLRLNVFIDLRILFQDAVCEYAGSTLQPAALSISELLRREGLPHKNLPFPLVGTGSLLQELRLLLMTSGARVPKALKHDDERPHHLAEQAASFLQKKGGGTLTTEGRQYLLVGDGAHLLDMQARLWKRAIEQDVFLSFRRSHDSPQLLRVSGYPLVYGEAGLGFRGVPVGIESKSDGNRRPYLALHFASFGSTPQPATAKDSPHSWGCVEREPTGERLLGPWGEQNTLPGRTSPQQRAPALFRAIEDPKPVPAVPELI